jgi:aminotransferase
MSDAAVTADLETYLSERVRSTPPSGIRRFFEIAATMDDVISLGIGEPDFVTPQPAVQAGIDALNNGQTSYTANAGRADLRTAISEELASRYGVSYDAEDEILSTVGVSEAMQLTMLSVLDPGDEILIPEPCFVSYAPTARFAEANVVHVPTSVENNFQVTAETLESYITPNTKALFLGYPNNPTGAVLRRDTLEDIAALVKKHDLLVISDEIYDRLVYGEAHERGHVCVPSIDGLRERTILLGGFSKGYAMTGWRIGYACAPAPILRGLYKVHQYMIMSAPTVSQIAGHTAITECQDEVETMRQAYDERRRVLVDGLNEAGLPTFEPEGAFYCFPDIRSTGLTSEAFVQQLLEEEHVACVPGDAFGPSGAGYVRCSYATGLDDVKEAVRRIQRFAAKHQNG